MTAKKSSGDLLMEATKYQLEKLLQLAEETARTFHNCATCGKFWDQKDKSFTMLFLQNDWLPLGVECEDCAAPVGEYSSDRVKVLVAARHEELLNHIESYLDNARKHYV